MEELAAAVSAHDQVTFIAARHERTVILNDFRGEDLQIVRVGGWSRRKALRDCGRSSQEYGGDDRTAHSLISLSDPIS
jgi:hypothetical protein